MLKYALPLLGLSVLIVLGWYIGTAFAHHRGIFLAEDSISQRLMEYPYPRTYANKAWALGADNDPIRYYAEPDIVGFTNIAVARWLHAVPDLRWLRVTSTSYEDRPGDRPSRFPLSSQGM